MVIRLLISALFVLASAPLFNADGRSLCHSCHTIHYAERGECVRCHRGNPAAARKNVAHHHLVAGRYAGYVLPDSSSLLKGRRLLDQFACRRCHRIGQRGNALSTNLDFVGSRRAPEELAARIRYPVQNMPDFRATEDQISELVTALLSEATKQKNPAVEKPRVVYFDQVGASVQDVFSVKCGACHRVLTLRSGALGRGTNGPNLSGLLSPLYPPTFRGHLTWTEQRLGEWLKNPRKSKPDAMMQPVALTEREFMQLVEILEVGK